VISAFIGAILLGEARWIKSVSLSASESDSASLHPNKITANPSRRVKPAVSRLLMSICVWRVVRGGWERRAEKDQSRNLGDPLRWIRSNGLAECIRLYRPPGKSDVFIVALKGVMILEPRETTVGQHLSSQGVPLDGDIRYGRIGVRS
jgi:hypothetical protein